MPLHYSTSLTVGSLGMHMGLAGQQGLMVLLTPMIPSPIPGHCLGMVGVPELLESLVRHLHPASVPSGRC